MATFLTITDLINQYGSYYINSGQNMQRLYKQLRFGFDTQQAFTPIVTDDTQWRAASASISRLIQPFQKAWTPISNLDFEPAAVTLGQMKIDIDTYLNDLQASWLGFLAGPGIVEADWPFVRWMLEQHVIPQAQEDLELNEIYNGVQTAITPGTPGAAGTSFNGIGYLIANYITNGQIAPITTGALSADPKTLYSQIETWTYSVNQRYWQVPMNIYMSLTNARLAKQGRHLIYGTLFDYEKGDNEKPINFTNFSIVGVPSMANSSRIWMTPKQNAVLCYKNFQNSALFNIGALKRELFISADNFWLAPGFIIPSIVFVNEQV